MLKVPQAADPVPFPELGKASMRQVRAVNPVPFPELGKADTRSGKGTGSTAREPAPVWPVVRVRSALARRRPEIVRYASPSPWDSTTGWVEGTVPAGTVLLLKPFERERPRQSRGLAFVLGAAQPGALRHPVYFNLSAAVFPEWWKLPVTLYGHRKDQGFLSRLGARRRIGKRSRRQSPIAHGGHRNVDPRQAD